MIDFHILILHYATLLNSITDIWPIRIFLFFMLLIFPEDFLCARSYHLQIGSFISCAPIWRNFLLFSWLNSWAQISLIILNWSIKNGHPWFVLHLTEKAFHLSWISRCWLWVLHRCSLSWWQSFHLFLV